nr:4081_t:CDS:2 [Entrophospora candida]
MAASFMIQIFLSNNFMLWYFAKQLSILANESVGASEPGDLSSCLKSEYNNIPTEADIDFLKNHQGTSRGSSTALKAAYGIFHSGGIRGSSSDWTFVGFLPLSAVMAGTVDAACPMDTVDDG